jgi:hypothetical protein
VENLGSHRRLFRKFWFRELARAFREAFRNGERAELVSTGEYRLLGIECGEVLLAPRYVNPVLEVERVDQMEASQKFISGSNLPGRSRQSKRGG